MTAPRVTAKWSCCVLLAAALSSVGSTARASEALAVGARPAQLKEKPSSRASVVTTLEPGTKVQVFDRQDGWCWVIVPASPSSEPIPNGWVRQEWLVADGPDRAGAPPALPHTAAPAPG